MSNQCPSKDFTGLVTELKGELEALKRQLEQLKSNNDAKTSTTELTLSTLTTQNNSRAVEIAEIKAKYDSLLTKFETEQQIRATADTAINTKLNELKNTASTTVTSSINSTLNTSDTSWQGELSKFLTGINKVLDCDKAEETECDRKYRNNLCKLLGGSCSDDNPTGGTDVPANVVSLTTEQLEGLEKVLGEWDTVKASILSKAPSTDVEAVQSNINQVQNTVTAVSRDVAELRQLRDQVSNLASTVSSLATASPTPTVDTALTERVTALEQRIPSNLAQLKPINITSSPIQGIRVQDNESGGTQTFTIEPLNINRAFTSDVLPSANALWGHLNITAFCVIPYGVTDDWCRSKNLPLEVKDTTIMLESIRSGTNGWATAHALVQRLTSVSDTGVVNVWVRKALRFFNTKNSVGMTTRPAVSPAQYVEVYNSAVDSMNGGVQMLHAFTGTRANNTIDQEGNFTAWTKVSGVTTTTTSSTTTPTGRDAFGDPI